MMDLEEYESLQPSMQVAFGGENLVFATPNRHAAWRVDTALTKEPDTVAWIDGFSAGDVFVDIGANIGLYSLMASARGARVYAFEPESQNYALLNRNIFLNGVGGRVSAFCIAVADRERYGNLYVAEFVAAGSCHSFGLPLGPLNEPMQPAYVQCSYSTTLDLLVERQAIPVPNHIKIDVDGIEPKVLAGAEATLHDERVRSVLVELNTNVDEHWGVVDRMLDLGFDYSIAGSDAARRQEGAFKGLGNYVFRR